MVRTKIFSRKTFVRGMDGYLLSSGFYHPCVLFLPDCEWMRVRAGFGSGVEWYNGSYHYAILHQSRTLSHSFLFAFGVGYIYLYLYIYLSVPLFCASGSRVSIYVLLLHIYIYIYRFF